MNYSWIFHDILKINENSIDITNNLKWIIQLWIEIHLIWDHLQLILTSIKWASIDAIHFTHHHLSIKYQKNTTSHSLSNYSVQWASTSSLKRLIRLFLINRNTIILWKWFRTTRILCHFKVFQKMSRMSLMSNHH